MNKADGKPGGANGEIQYNDRGAFSGAAGVTSATLSHVLIRSTYAICSLTLAVQPTIGDTITVGALTYIYVDTPPNPGEIFIDVDLATTQANTITNINRGIGATLPDAGALPFNADVSVVVSALVGTAGNGIVSTSAFTNAANHFNQASLSGGTDGSTGGHIQGQTATLTGSSAASPVLRLNQAAGTDSSTQGNTFEIVDSNGNNLINIDDGGNLYTFRDLRMVDPGHNAIFTVSQNKVVYGRIADANGSFQIVMEAVPNDQLLFSLRPFAGVSALIHAHTTGAVALEIDTSGEIGASADLIQAFGNANFDLVFRLMQSGAVVIAQHSAPADADLNTGDMALWFDQTNGASKLMIKAKDALGAVVTGEVALL